MKSVRSGLVVLAGAAIAGAVFAACADGDKDTTLTTKPEGSAMPVDHPPVEAAGVVASTRRLDVAQLQAAWAVALGKDVKGNDITWRLPDGAPGLSRYARSLGEPDYLASTDLSYEPSLLFAKFTDDAARSVCDQALDADQARTDKTARVILRFVEWTDLTQTPALDENLRYLKLRFHGVRIAPEDSKSIEALRTLYLASAKGGAREGWRTVCVALVTAPEFNLH